MGVSNGRVALSLEGGWVMFIFTIRFEQYTGNNERAETEMSLQYGVISISWIIVNATLQFAAYFSFGLAYLCFRPVILKV